VNGDGLAGCWLSVTVLIMSGHIGALAAIMSSAHMSGFGTSRRNLGASIYALI
jgi:hypothetical protein